MSVVDLKCEYLENPVGIDITAPRLSWKLATKRPGARQVAYQVIAATSPEKVSAGDGDLWDSGWVESDQSIHVVYQGAPLGSRQIVYWRVTVWDETGAANTSSIAHLEMGLLHPDDWQASWIGSDLYSGPRSMFPAPYLRKQFIVEETVNFARLYITVLGMYECTINGQQISEDVFAPGWTEYGKRIQYNVYDVTNLLRSGENVIGVVLGDGWAVGHTSWNHRQAYADRPQLFAQLELTLASGKQVIVTDGTWQTKLSPILHNDTLMGEAYDARRELPGWNLPGYNAANWNPVAVCDAPQAAVAATNGPTMRRVELLSPVSDPVEKGRFDRKRYIFDLGQNMVGRIIFKGIAPAGTTVVFRFAEVLNPDGSIYLLNLRQAKATDYYTFKGEGEEVWEPKFTFHGFRYVEVSGYPGPVSRDTVTGVVIHSQMAETGCLESSDPLLNQLQRNIVWGQKGNFLDVPTDCPQRDERLGWTGDIQVFLPTAAFNMDVSGFMTKWLQDLLDSQGEDGSIPSVAPNAPGIPQDGGPAWSDAIVICPYTLYLNYGDTRILERTYEAMTRFMAFLERTSPGYIRCAPEYEGWPGYGDWLSINADTPRDLIGTAFYAHDADLLSRIAAILGKDDDATRYQQLFEDIKAAFAARYLKGSTVTTAQDRPSIARKLMDDADAISRGNLRFVAYGTNESDVFNTNLFQPTQTAYVLGLHFNLLPEAMRQPAVKEMVADIERREMHLSTGFVGAPYLPHVLSDNGQLETAYALLNQRTWPSWLYSVTQGATTIWERWDGWTEESGFQSPDMNSFNHYAYGSIGAWMVSTIAGIQIDPAQPAYKHTILRPQPGGGLDHATAKLETPYGTLESSWQMTGGKFIWTVIVPPNTTATAHLPSGETRELAAGTHHITEG